MSAEEKITNFVNALKDITEQENHTIELDKYSYEALRKTIREMCEELSVLNMKVSEDGVENTGAELPERQETNTPNAFMINGVTIYYSQITGEWKNINIKNLMPI